MKSYDVRIRVRFKDGILDPQAVAIETALKRLSFDSVENVECDKLYAVKVKAEDEADAAKLGRQMADKLLVNVVMENFEVEVGA